jgi:DNA primase
MNCGEFLTYFEDVRGSNGKYMARCPAHNDHNPSLCITDVEDRILIHCFAGCSAKEILDCLDLKFNDLKK